MFLRRLHPPHPSQDASEKFDDLVARVVEGFRFESEATVMGDGAFLLDEEDLKWAREAKRVSVKAQYHGVQGSPNPLFLALK